MQENSFYREVYYTPLSNNERFILERMLKNSVTSAEIASFLGTEDLSRARVVVSKIRRKLRGVGWKISMNEGGRRAVGTYRLERRD